MKRLDVCLLALVLVLLSGCWGNDSDSTPPPLNASNLNLIFVSSPDLAHHARGDIQYDTANLTSQGLQRSLLMATYLKQRVLGMQNVTGIYALTPMTHLQTANGYPDMTAIGFIQQFALLNQITLPVTPLNGSPSEWTGNSYPINVAYATGSVPAPVSPRPAICPDCAGLDFNNAKNNAALVAGIIDAPPPNWAGNHVFSAPWETIRDLMASIDAQRGYHLDLPATYQGPNQVYAIAIAPTGSARLVTYVADLNPPATYPVLPAPVTSASCPNPMQPYFKSVRIGGVDGVSVPSNANVNQTTYIVRHADAHPDPSFSFEDGNFVGAGQWRSLALANTLRGRIRPTVAYSIDPAQWYPISATRNVSYVRPSLTILPYVIANNLPYFLAYTFPLAEPADDPTVADNTVDQFFTTKGGLSNQTVLLAWESGHIRPMLNRLITRYGGNPALLPTASPPDGQWPHADYDTIWTVTLDARGNLTVDNALCEGIDSATLPKAAPLF